MQRFVNDIDAMIAETVKMGDLAAEMIAAAVDAVTTNDVQKAQKVIADFEAISRYDTEIEDMATRILTLYQPTAVDTRTIVAVLKSITYLERIGKYSKNIAVATEYLSQRESYPPRDLIAPMGRTVVEMVRIVTKGFEEKSVDGFGSIVEKDDYLDETMRESLMEIVGFINSNENSADVCTYYISILKFLERVGDHACKMAEKINFMVTGMHVVIR